jgi:N-sulfoglucosamine sulfohydrolase
MSLADHQVDRLPFSGLCRRLLTLILGLLPRTATAAEPVQRPNILLCISDDQSWAHVGAMGDPVVQTPAFDRVAKEGLLLTHAFCDAPSCAPSRSALLTGQHIWRLEEAANLHCRLPEKLPTYVRLLEQAGYATGSYAKAWAPGQFKTSAGWVHHSQSQQNPAGPLFDSFEQFLQQRPIGQPFCFWLGSHDAHRPYDVDAGLQAGMKPEAVKVPPHLPDTPVVRRDLLDYLFEIQRFDGLVAKALAALEQRGELDNTLVVITSDNGMPFPRAKATLYDYGTRMPLAMRWPAKLQSPGRTSDALVHLSDLAPTFLEAAGVTPPPGMTALSLMDLILDHPSLERQAAWLAMERHDGCRPGGAGYPCRGLRTRDFLYIRNYTPERWPAGDPDAAHCARAIPFGEVDSSPTKSLLIEGATEPALKKFYDLAFAKRPAEELYDLRHDPGQLINVASQPEYADRRQAMAAWLTQYTGDTGDPRALGEYAPWDHYPYFGIRLNKDWKVDKDPGRLR